MILYSSATQIMSNNEREAKNREGTGVSVKACCESNETKGGNFIL